MPSVRDHHRIRLMHAPVGTGELLDVILEAMDAGETALVDECLTLRERALRDDSPRKGRMLRDRYEAVNLDEEHERCETRT